MLSRIRMIALLAITLTLPPTLPLANLPVPYDEQDEFLREKISEHISDDPLLAIIAGCETTNNPQQIKHWEADGSLVKNPHSSASGAFQVLLQFHRDWINETGKNMQDIDEYMQFVAILFELQGYNAWYPSKDCWGKYRHLGTS